MSVSCLPISIGIADDHKLFREGLKTLLQNEPEINVVGEARNGQEAVTLAQDLKPDIILMDIEMPILDGIEAFSLLRCVRHAISLTLVYSLSMHLLYGGRNSLQIGAEATLITIVLATVLGILAGYFRGPVDGFISRAFELIWAFPVYLLGISLGVVLALSGLDLGFVKISGSSLLITSLIVGLIFTPYVGKPIRGQVLGLREREFIDAARQQGLGHVQIMFQEILPNVASTIIVFIPLVLANAILTEAGLSYLGAGVRPPNPSWGTMIGDGIRLLPSAVHTMLVPGIMLMLCVLGINVFGDGVRDALDPRAKIRIEH